MKKIPFIEDDILQKYLIPNPNDESTKHINKDIRISDLTKNSRKIYIEICSGNGHFLVELAENYPEYYFIGVEIKKKRVLKSIYKSNYYKLENIAWANIDGKLFLENYINDNSIDGLYINFPDPWTKKRHIKNRIIQEDFVDFSSKKLKTKSFLYLVSDNLNYMEWSIDIFSKQKKLNFVFPDKIRCDIYDYQSSLFAEKWEELDNRTFYFCKMIKS